MINRVTDKAITETMEIYNRLNLIKVNYTKNREYTRRINNEIRKNKNSKIQNK